MRRRVFHCAHWPQGHASGVGACRQGCKCDEGACPLISITSCLEKTRASMMCRPCVEEIDKSSRIEDLSACVISQERTKRAFTLRLGKACGTAQSHAGAQQLARRVYAVCSHADQGQPGLAIRQGWRVVLVGAGRPKHDAIERQHCLARIETKT